jgi:predicted MFS family arabinose efflux permease
MRIKIMLVILLLGIIFPMHSIGQLSTLYKRIFDSVFEPEWMHIAMHTALFAGLAAILTLVTRPPWRAMTLMLVCGLILGAGILQEIFQWLTQDKAVPLMIALRSSAFDLGVDLSGGLLGIAVLFWVDKVFASNRLLDKRG